MKQVGRTGIGALVLTALLTAGCAGTPQPPSADGGAGSAAVPTGTAVPTGGATSSTPAAPSATGASPSGDDAGPVGSEAPGGQALPAGWPGVPLPPGTITSAVREGDDGPQTLWRVVVSSTGSSEAVADSLKSRYQAAGWTIASDTSIPGAGRVLTTRNDRLGVSIMAKGQSGDRAEVETLVRTLT